MMTERELHPRRLRFVEQSSRQQDARFGTMCPELALVLLDTSEHPREVLFQADLFLEPMLEWLRDSEAAIREDPPAITQRPGETVGVTLARAYDLIDDDMDVDVALLVYKSLFHYNSHHNFGFGAPGMDIPRVMIGRGERGVEVCNWIENATEDHPWRHVVDVDDFFAHLPAL